MGCNMTIPNLLSIFRIAIIPAFVYFYLSTEYYILAAAILVLSGATDALDGYIARKYNQISYLGVILDPLADKLTQAAMCICVAIRYPQILLLLIVFFVKELCMVVGSLIMVKRGIKVAPSIWYGKIATFGFYFVMIIIVAMPPMSGDYVFIASLAVVGLLLVAFAQYLKLFVKIIKEDNKKKSEIGSKIDLD